MIEIAVDPALEKRVEFLKHKVDRNADSVIRMGCEVVEHARSRRSPEPDAVETRILLTWREQVASATEAAWLALRAHGSDPDALLLGSSEASRARSARPLRQSERQRGEAA